MIKDNENNGKEKDYEIEFKKKEIEYNLIIFDKEYEKECSKVESELAILEKKVFNYISKFILFQLKYDIEKELEFILKGQQIVQISQPINFRFYPCSINLEMEIQQEVKENKEIEFINNYEKENIKKDDYEQILFDQNEIINKIKNYQYQANYYSNYYYTSGYQQQIPFNQQGNNVMILPQTPDGYFQAKPPEQKLFYPQQPQFLFTQQPNYFGQQQFYNGQLPNSYNQQNIYNFQQFNPENNLANGPNKEEKFISMMIVSNEEDIYCSFICKSTDKFKEVEKQLYEVYPEYSKRQNLFFINGIKIDKNKSLEENGIKNNSLITIK